MYDFDIDHHIDQYEESEREFLADLRAGRVLHRHPLTEADAAIEADLTRQENERMSDLFDNDNPDSIWYR